MTLSLSDKIDRLQDAAVDRLYRFLRTDGASDDDRMDARIAATTLSAVTRQRATENARDTLGFAMARLTTDPAYLQEYIRVGAPSRADVKALPMVEAR